jgi:hypothetical protein
MPNHRPRTGWREDVPVVSDLGPVRGCIGLRSAGGIRPHGLGRITLTSISIGDTLAVTAQGRLHASLEVMSLEVGAGGELRYRIRNMGDVRLICGLHYRLERKVGENEWMLMNAGVLFRTIGFGVDPGQYKELTARIPADAPAGLYRLLASVGSDHVPGRVEASAEFRVVDGR